MTRSYLKKIVEYILMFFFWFKFNSLGYMHDMFLSLPLSLFFLCPAEVTSSPVVGKDVPTIHHKKEEAGMPEGKPKIIKENGERHTNGTGAAYRSERSEEMQPDVMDDHLGKYR